MLTRVSVKDGLAATARERGRRRSPWPSATAWMTADARARTWAVGGMAVWMGEFDEAERWLRRAWEIAEPQIDPATAVLLARRRRACCTPLASSIQLR